MSTNKSNKEIREEVASKIISALHEANSWFESNWKFFIACSTGLGLWWLFHFINSFNVPMPLSLSHLSAFAIALTLSGAYFIFNMVIITFLPIYSGILIDKKSLKKSTIYGRKGSFIRFMMSSGIILLSFCYGITLLVFKSLFDSAPVWTEALPIIALAAVFFGFNFSTKKQRKYFNKVANHNVAGVFITALWITTVFFITLVALAALLSSNTEMLTESSMWSWILCFVGIGFVLIAISYGLIKLSYDNEAKNFSVALFAIFTVFSILPPIATSMGQISLNILNLGGGAKVCYVFSKSHLESMPPELKKLRSTSKLLRNYLSTGEKVFVSLNDSKARIFSIPKEAIISESWVSGFGRNRLESQKSCHGTSQKFKNKET